MLGAEETQTGVVEVLRAEQKFSRAKAVTGQIGASDALRRFVATEGLGTATDQAGEQTPAVGQGLVASAVAGAG